MNLNSGTRHAGGNEENFQATMLLHFLHDDSDDDNDDHRNVAAVLERGLRDHRANMLARFYAPLSQNDPRVTEVKIDSQRFQQGYAVALGTALQGNTHVSKLTLEMDLLQSPEQRHRVASLTPLVQFIQTGPALKVLELHCTGSRRVALPVVRRILHAAATNTSLEELKLPYNIDVAHHVDAFCILMGKTQSLRQLTVSVRVDAKPASLERVAAALGSNRTLDCLAIAPGANSALVDSLLLQLSTQPRLKKLKIHHAFIDTPLELANLGTFLQSSVSQLGSLDLGGCAFDDRTIEDLLLGLRNNATLEKLSLQHCCLDGDAAKKFRQFFRNDSGCNIRELGFICCAFFQPTRNGTRFDAGKLAAELLTNNQSTSHGIGKLTLDLGNHGIDGFASNVSKIHLQHLEFGESIKASGLNLLGTLLPNTCFLRELTIPMNNQLAVAETFLQGLRRNGSLHQVHFSQVVLQLPKAKARRLQAYLARNRYASQWLTHANQTKALKHEDCRLLFPGIVFAIQPVQKMAPNMILAGLMAMGDDGIGRPISTSLSGTVRLL